MNAKNARKPQLQWRTLFGLLFCLLAFAPQRARTQTVPLPAATNFGMSSFSSHINPTPFPPLNRSCCGDKWLYLEKARGAYSWNTLDAWAAQAAANGAPQMYTFLGTPNWANGNAGPATEPDDLYGAGTASAPVPVACRNVLRGTTATDCQWKEFITALMRHECGVASQPAQPILTCSIRIYEIWNEFNGNGYWRNSYQDLARMAQDAAQIIRAYCGNCTILGGSVSAGGDGYNPAGGSAQYDLAELAFLEDWAALPSPSLPDAVSFHTYAARTSVWPDPWPTSIVSDSSPLCTSANTPNVNCRRSISTQIANLRTAVLGNPAIASWAANLPIWVTEGGWGMIMQIGDEINVSLSGNGALVTATATHALPASWTTGSYILMNNAAPSGFNETSPVAITVTGSTTFTYANTTSGSSAKDGVALQVTSADYDTAATWNLRQAWVAQWMIVQALQSPQYVLGYAYGDGGWMTMYGSGAHIRQYPNNPIVPNGPTPALTAWVQTLAWLTNTVFTGSLHSTAVTGGNIWTVNLQHNGSFAQLAWFDGWQGTASYTLINGMTRAQNLSGTVTTIGAGGVATLTNSPQLLY